MAYDIKALFFDGTEPILGAAVNSRGVWIGETHTNEPAVNIDARVTEAFAGGTSIKVTFQTSDVEGFTGAKTLMEKTIAVADLTLGAPLGIGTIPDGALTYIRLKVEPAGTFTTGHIWAAVSEGVVSATFSPLNPPVGSRF